jgi:serine phosphatase RsbU (regulator of sigma subunit)
LPAAYEPQRIYLLPGDVLLAFTAGISEAMNVAEDEWGEDRMIAEAQASGDLNAAELMQRLFRTADTFAAGAPQHDDMTPVVLRISVLRSIPFILGIRQLVRSRRLP